MKHQSKLLRLRNTVTSSPVGSFSSDDRPPTRMQKTWLLVTIRRKEGGPLALGLLRWHLLRTKGDLRFVLACSLLIISCGGSEPLPGAMGRTLPTRSSQVADVPARRAGAECTQEHCTWTLSIDIDEDGKSDEVRYRLSKSGGMHDISIDLGNGEGRFTQIVGNLSSVDPRTVAPAIMSGDLDGRSGLEIIVFIGSTGGLDHFRLVKFEAGKIEVVKREGGDPMDLIAGHQGRVEYGFYCSLTNRESGVPTIYTWSEDANRTSSVNDAVVDVTLWTWYGTRLDLGSKRGGVSTTVDRSRYKPGAGCNGTSVVEGFAE